MKDFTHLKVGPILMVLAGSISVQWELFFTVASDRKFIAKCTHPVITCSFQSNLAYTCDMSKHNRGSTVSAETSESAGRGVVCAHQYRMEEGSCDKTSHS